MSTATLEPTTFFDSTFFGVPLGTILGIIIISVIAIVIERSVTRYLRRFSRRTKVEPHVANNLALTFRIIVLIAAAAAISRLGGISSEWIISISAIGAAAVGFASQKTIGNFAAGIFLIAARPFKVGNYVRIGTVEGIVSEITINYTKVLTASNNLVSISNQQIVDREITNFLYQTKTDEDLYCYTFELNFDHTVSAQKISEIFMEIFENYIDLPKKPNFIFTRSTAAERVYTIYLYVNEPETIFSLRPKIAQEVFQRWDEERAKIKK